MALALQAYTFAQQYIYESCLHSVPKKNENALRVGVLSMANINAASIIHPASSHSDVILYAIASRSLSGAASHAKKYGFQKTYGSYSDLLDDPNVDFCYISLPNAMHYSWACKALKAGKHVLVEKPFTSNAEEAQALINLAQEQGKIVMEAFHWQFHPAAHLFRSIMNNLEARGGRVIKTHARMTSTPAIPSKDIRWQYDLGGGSLMDMTYVISFTCFALGLYGDDAGLPEEIVSARAELVLHKPQVDRAMHATLKFKSKLFAAAPDESVASTIYTDLARPWAFGVVPRVWELPSLHVETEGKEIYFYNIMMPHVYHYISITDKSTRNTVYEKCYAGGPAYPAGKGKHWWSTYRYQLEAFMDKLRGREPAWWVDNRDSVVQMQVIDNVYRKAGLKVRGKTLTQTESF